MSMSDENKTQVLNPEIEKLLIKDIIRDERDGLLFKQPDIEIIKKIQERIFKRASKDIKDKYARGDKL